MDAERERLLNELRHYQPPAPHADRRADALARLIEADPPQLHSYPAMTVIAFVSTGVGIVLVILAVIGIDLALAATGAISATGGPAWLLAAEAGSRSLLVSASIVAGLAGFGFIASGEQLRLWIDLQHNADRQAIALHGIYQLLRANRPAASNDIHRIA